MLQPTRPSSGKPQSVLVADFENRNQDELLETFSRVGLRARQSSVAVWEANLVRSSRNRQLQPCLEALRPS